MRNDKGKTITSRKGIATVFGEFYSKMYAEHQFGEEVQDPQNLETRINTKKKSWNEEVRNEIPDFTQDEVQAAIDNLKKVKQVTTTESGPKTSRHAVKRRKKWSDRSSTKCWSKRTAHQKLGEGIRFKVTYNKEMWKKLVTTVCQRFTNCSQQSFSTDFTTDSTKRNQETREDLDDLTKLWTISKHTDCWNRSAGSGVPKCGSRQWTSWRHLTQ